MPTRRILWFDQISPKFHPVLSEFAFADKHLA
jgi:hypothetical protein